MARSIKFITTVSLIYFSVVSAEYSASSFLINGKTAIPGTFPFLAHISTTNEITGRTRVDSAVLISDRHLLAKSEFLQGWGDVTVLLGAFYPYIPDGQTQSFFVLHEDIIFKEPIQAGFDIAIIPLPRRAIFTDRIQPILLPRWSDKGKTYEGIEGTVSGWLHAGGLTFAGYDEVEIRPHNECGTLRQPEELCIAREVVSAGDNGVPLVVEGDDGREVVGIFSYYAIFKPEAEWVKTNVFIKLNEHLDFIAENTGVAIRP